jgi:hypothetical protein
MQEIPGVGSSLSPTPHLFSHFGHLERQPPHRPVAATTGLQSPRMKLEKGLTFKSFDESKDHMQTWAVTKKFTPQVLKKERYDEL